VVVNIRLTVVGRLPELRAEPTRVAFDRDAPAAHTRRVYIGGWTDVPVHDLDALPGGLDLKGPAIFESPTTTVLIRDRERATVTPHGWLDIEVA
jgi:N-methylhydantoinase A